LAIQESTEREWIFYPSLGAYEALRKVICERPPLNEWRPKEVRFPEGTPSHLKTELKPSDVGNAFEPAVWAYELCSYLDLIKKKFGSPVAEKTSEHILVLSGFDKTLESRLPILFKAVEAAIATHDPASSPQFADNPSAQFHLTLAGSILYVSDWPKERKAPLLMTLAQCLDVGKYLAESAFLGELEKARRTVDSIQWSSAPGPFERQLQRKVGNPLFPPSDRKPTDAQVISARVSDLRNTAEFLRRYRLHVQEAMAWKDKMLNLGQVSDFLYRSFDLMESCAVLGNYFSPEMEVLKAAADASKGALAAAVPDAAANEQLAKYESLVVFQCSTPMIIARTLEELGTATNEEWIRSVFSEDLETIRESGVYAASIGLDLLQDATSNVEVAVRDGMWPDFAKKKLDAFSIGIQEGARMYEANETTGSKPTSGMRNATKRFFRRFS